MLVAPCWSCMSNIPRGSHGLEVVCITNVEVCLVMNTNRPEGKEDISGFYLKPLASPNLWVSHLCNIACHGCSEVGCTIFLNESIHADRSNRWMFGHGKMSGELKRRLQCRMGIRK